MAHYHHWLMAVHAFGKYVRGSIIREEEEIKRILASVDMHAVVKFYPRPEHVNGTWDRNVNRVAPAVSDEPHHTAVPV